MSGSMLSYSRKRGDKSCHVLLSPLGKHNGNEGEEGNDFLILFIKEYYVCHQLLFQTPWLFKLCVFKILSLENMVNFTLAFSM